MKSLFRRGVGDSEFEIGVVEAKIWSDTLSATLTFLASSDPGAVVGDGVLVLALGEEEEVWRNMPDNKDLDK